METQSEAVTKLLKAMASVAMTRLPYRRVITFDDPTGSIEAMAAAYVDYSRAHIGFPSPAAFDKLAAGYHVTIHWSGSPAVRA